MIVISHINISISLLLRCIKLFLCNVNSPSSVDIWNCWHQFDPDFGAVDTNLVQILEPLTPIWFRFWSRWRHFDSDCGAVDAKCCTDFGVVDTNLIQILESLTSIWFGFWSRWHELSGKSGAVDAIWVEFLTRKKQFFGILGGLEVEFGKIKNWFGITKLPV